MSYLGRGQNIITKAQNLYMPGYRKVKFDLAPGSPEQDFIVDFTRGLSTTYVFIGIVSIKAQPPTGVHIHSVKLYLNLGKATGSDQDVVIEREMKNYMWIMSDDENDPNPTNTWDLYYWAGDFASGGNIEHVASGVKIRASSTGGGQLIVSANFSVPVMALL